MRAGGVRSVPPQQATAQSPASARRHAQRSAANDGIRPHLSENLERNAGAGLGIGQRMVVVFEVEAAGGRNGMELVVGQAAAEDAARSAAGAVEAVAGIGHAVELEDGLEAPFVEGRVVGHEGQPLDAGGNLLPHGAEIGGIGRIGIAQAVDGGGEGAVVVGTGTDEAVERIDHLAAAHDHHAHRADAGALAVGRFEINGGKIGHGLQSILTQLRTPQGRSVGGRCKDSHFRHRMYSLPAQKPPPLRSSGRVPAQEWTPGSPLLRPATAVPDAATSPAPPAQKPPPQESSGRVPAQEWAPGPSFPSPRDHGAGRSNKPPRNSAATDSG